MAEGRLRRVSSRDRTIGLLLTAAALAAWLCVAWLVTNVSPAEEAELQLLGAVAIGLAAALTVWPVVWLQSARRGHGGSGYALATAGRRAGLVGFLVVVIIVLRLLGVFELPTVVFAVAMAALVELAFSVRR
jgi:hypothetical protein